MAQAVRQAATTERREGRTQAQRRDDAERRILEAAAAIAAERGFEALTLAQVGERAGCSRGLPSHYFRTKDDLLAALGVYIVEAFMAGRKAHAAGANGFQSLIKSLQYYFEMPVAAADSVRAFHAVLAAGLHTAAIAESVARLNRDSRIEIAAGLRAGIEAGEVRPDVDPDTTAILVLATLRGTIAQWLMDPDGVNLARVGKQFVSNLQRDLGR